MSSTKRLRYAGFILMTAAALLLLYLCSVTLRSGYKAPPEDYAVLVITEDTHIFPVTDYDVLFSELKLPSSRCVLDPEDNADAVTAGIASAINESGSEHVILLAYGDAAMPVLNASLGQENAASVILLAPTLQKTDSLEAFGTASPSVPTAIFTFSSEYSSALYERMSGEDTTLFPGLGGGKVISSTAFISPDASRYIESWALTGHESIDRAILPVLPDTQVRIGDYINNYVLPEKMRSEADLNRADAIFQVLKIIASACLLSGLMLFFASIPKSPRRESRPAGTASPFVGEKNEAGISVFRRSAAGSLVFSGVSGAIVSIAVVILYAGGVSAASAVLFCWPLVFYAIDGAFHFRTFANSLTAGKISGKRRVLSVFLMLFFLLGCGAIRFMYTAGLSRNDGLGSYAFGAGTAVLLFLVVWMSAAAENHAKPIEDSRLDSMIFWRKMILFVPFASLLVFRLTQGEIFKAALTAGIAGMLLMGLWIRGIFRRLSGEDWGGAAAFSVFYAIAMII